MSPRAKLPETRRSITHKAELWTRAGRVKFFFTVGYVPASGGGRLPMELFMHMDEAGSTLHGFAEAWALMTSLYWQTADASLETWVRHMAWQRFEPRSIPDGTGLPPMAATSVVDYVARWVAREFAVPVPGAARDGEEGDG